MLVYMRKFILSLREKTFVCTIKMSILRKRSLTINAEVTYNNNLRNFTNPPISTGNLYVNRNQGVGNNLDICGNLTVGQNIKANSFYATGNYFLNNYILIPAGTIIQSAAVIEPDGWYICDGRSLSTTAFSALFNALGYTYGGSGVNFNIPDMRGRVAVGAGSNPSLTSRSLGTTGGEETHTLTAGEMPSHTHTSNATGGAVGLVRSTGNNTAGSGLDNTANEPDLYAQPLALTINTAGSGQSHNNMQPFIVLQYLIKY